MKVEDIKKISIETTVNDEDEKYKYMVEYNRIGDNEFKPQYTTTSKTKMCIYCGSWKYGDDEDCTCENTINLTENETIDILEESINFDNTRVYVNGYAVN